MREQFVREFITKISNNVDDATLIAIEQALFVHVCDYDISKRETSIVPYDPIPECVKTYLVTRKIEGIAMSTLKLYKLRLGQFFTSTSKPLGNITPSDVRRYLYEYQERSGCSNRTLDGIRGNISTFFKWACCEGYIGYDPCANIKAIKYVRKERGHLSDDEVEMLRNACKNVRDRGIVEMLYSTGCRVSELVNLKIKDVDLQNGEVTLFGKGSKYRTSYLNAKCKLLLKEYLLSRGDESEYLFVSLRKPHNKISKNNIEKLVKKIGIEAGITQNVYPHLIRHTTASLALQRGMDITEIQKILGHERIDTTLIYAKVLESSVKQSHKRCIV